MPESAAATSQLGSLRWPASPARVAIVGLGLIGGSLARTLIAEELPVAGWDPDPATRDLARDAGVQVVEELGNLGAIELDLVVVAVPLRAVGQTARRLAAVLAPQVLVCDVGSVKGQVRREMVAAGLGSRYVGAHPMAGTEHSGFLASDAELLRGARWALTLDDSTPLAGFLLLAELITGPLGGVVLPLSDDVHDEAAALISHLPHVLATELLNIVANSPSQAVAVGLAAGSFRDGTRVARTTPRRTQAMVTDNADWVSAALRLVIRDLDQLATDLESNGPTDDFFDRGDGLRDDGSGAEPSSAVAVVEQLGDRAGWQRYLVELGAAGGQIHSVNAVGRSVVVLKDGAI